MTSCDKSVKKFTSIIPCKTFTNHDESSNGISHVISNDHSNIPLDNSLDFANVIAIINSDEAIKIAPLIIDNRVNSLFADLRKGIMYIYEVLNIAWPFKDAGQFIASLKSYKPFKMLLFDLGPKRGRIHASYPKDFMIKVKEWWKLNKDKSHIEDKGITEEIFNSIPIACDIPFDKITVLEHSQIMKPVIELIPDPMVPSTTIISSAPGTRKTEAC